jgi:hypothetical protein
MGNGQGSDAGRSTNDGRVTYSTAPRDKPDTSTGQARNERVAAKSTTKPKG